MSIVPNMTSAELLGQAKSVYLRTAVGYRDGILETGQLLHEFVLAYLQEGNPLPHNKRGKEGYTRHIATARAAEELGVTGDEINRWIAAAMVVAILAEDGNVGQLSYSSIRYFRCFVIRCCPGDRCKSQRSKWKGVPISDAETWTIKPKFAQIAPELFRLAVAENYGEERTCGECQQLLRGGKESRVGRPRRTGPLPAGDIHERSVAELLASSREEGRQTMRQVARSASPGDVAEMCLKLVQEAEDPRAVALLLQARLLTLLGRKKVV